MEDKFNTPHIYKPIMAGLFAGIVATMLNIVFDVVYRSNVNFPRHELINVSTIIFGTLLLLSVAGCIYALIDRYSKHVVPVYMLLSVLWTIGSMYLTMQVQRSDNALISSEFRSLLSGIVIITGIASTFLIPYLAKNETNII